MPTGYDAERGAARSPNVTALMAGPMATTLQGLDLGTRCRPFFNRPATAVSWDLCAEVGLIASRAVLYVFRLHEIVRGAAVGPDPSRWGVICPRQGVVTGTEAKSQRSGWRARLGRSRGCLPCKGRLGSERPERAAGDEVALKVERVVDRSMHRQKALG
jgi:hypothetical protein